MAKLKDLKKMREYIGTTDIYNIKLLVEHGRFSVEENSEVFNWTKEEVQEFAKELLEGFPIEPIYHYRTTDYKYVVISGQCRVLALYLWHEGKYIKEGSTITLNNIKFSDLEETSYYIENEKGERVDIQYDNFSKTDKRVIAQRIPFFEVVVCGDNEEEKEINLKKLKEKFKK